jgi:DNA-binding transcriptional LysR family regulator
MILKGDIELALSFLPTESTDLAYSELFGEEVVLVVSPHHELAQRDQVRLTDLADVPLMLPSQLQNTRRLLDDLFVQYGVKPKIIAEVDDLHALLTMTYMGTAATVLSRMAVSDTIGVKCIKFVEGEKHKLRAVVMWDKRTALTPAAKAFLNVVQIHCQERSSKFTAVPDRRP